MLTNTSFINDMLTALGRQGIEIRCGINVPLNQIHETHHRSNNAVISLPQSPHAASYIRCVEEVQTADWSSANAQD